MRYRSVDSLLHGISEYWANSFLSIVYTMTAYKNEEEYLDDLREALEEIVDDNFLIPQELLEACGTWITNLVMRFL